MQFKPKPLAIRYVVAFAGVIAVLSIVSVRDFPCALLALVLADVALWGVPLALARAARR